MDSLTPPPVHPWAEFLPALETPGRYLGGEEHQIVKAATGLVCRFVLAFPDVYEIGMSHLGTRIIYDLVNRQADLACERAFTPWFDAERELRARALPLVSLESWTPLAAFDVVGVSLQYELSYTNVLANLDLGGIPLRSEQRSDTDPIVIAGGPTATHPEPLAPFIDAFLVGEAEEVLPALLRAVGAVRRAGGARTEQLAAIAGLPGVYVPAYYLTELDERTGFEVVQGRSEAGVAAGAPERVERVYTRDLGKFPFPERFPVPYAQAIFDRAAVEITRGCTEGCRFCQAGMIYRPVRERAPDEIVRAVIGGIEAAGYAETSLTALSTADVSCIHPLIKRLVPELAERKVSLGIASLRAYGLDEELLDDIRRVGIDGLTFAPEAGTQRMRDVINKNVSEADILESARRIFSRGFERMKIYFIMGLPTETEADVAGIVETGRRCLEVGREVGRELGLPRLPTVTVSVSQHVPKPHTPFQWAAMDPLGELESKGRMLRDLARRARVGLKTHDARESWLECVFARGDRRLGALLEEAYRRGARFDGWREGFSLPRWLEAMEAVGIEPARYTGTIPVGARLPWDHLEMGFEPGFLEGEWRRAVRGRTSPPCGKPAGAQVHPRSTAEAVAQTRRLVCYDCGIACDLTQMREDRLEALRALEASHDVRAGVTEEPGTAAPVADVVPLARLTGRLARSKLADDSAFKAAAEAPYSRLRVVFAKDGPQRFLSHLDLVRNLPRMFRRAGISLAFSRGYNPQPRMSFGPALPLGASAEREIVDIDVLLPESARDMLGDLPADTRADLARDLADRLRAVALPGFSIKAARLLRPDEPKLGKQVVGTEWSVALAPAELERVRVALERLAEGAPVVVEREVRRRSRHHGKRRDRGTELRRVDVGAALLHAAVDPAEGRLRFRLRLTEGASARPREVAAALGGASPADTEFCRHGLLGADEVGALRALG